jgi:hypothetical protein
VGRKLKPTPEAAADWSIDAKIVLPASVMVFLRISSV